jgi:Holliday junction resolvase
MSNKSLGNGFERELCERLSKEGFWVHNLTQNSAGQPADIIAVQDGYAYLIDCKVCSNDKFPFSRIEENQDLAMTLWRDCGNGQGWFALKLEDEIYMFPHSLIEACREVQSGFDKQEIKGGIPIGAWVM